MQTRERNRSYQWTNPLETAEKVKTMSGLDYMQGILDGKLPHPPIADTLDFMPLNIAKGKIIFEMIPQEFHYNPIGSVHGGVISTILDTVMECALHSVLEQGAAYTTMELKVNFIKPVTYRSGRMLAEGRIIHVGKSTALLEADFKSEDGTLYAHGTSTCILFRSATHQKNNQ